MLEVEREATEEAARGVADPTALIQHSETRAKVLSGEYVDDPMLIKPGKDRPREVREELSDARNHLVFHFQEHPEDERNHRYLLALRYIALAYQEMLAE